MRFLFTGYYADSILKFRVRFPFTYPARAPEVTFTTDVFHPLISNEDGTLNIAPRFSPWKYVLIPEMKGPIYYCIIYADLNRTMSSKSFIG